MAAVGRELEAGAFGTAEEIAHIVALDGGRRAGGALRGWFHGLTCSVGIQGATGGAGAPARAGRRRPAAVAGGLAILASPRDRDPFHGAAAPRRPAPAVSPRPRGT
ncbi:hypothetical protein Bpla01_02160 [Burkholderia plantarii]|nr:hypothetical protein Bpla01_02160 [Burkholderia plantarii]